MARRKDRTRQEINRGVRERFPEKTLEKFPEKTVFRTATYARLSVESRYTKSESIASQQMLMRDYLKDREEFFLVGEYQDDGVSGTRFDRQGFDRMLGEVRKGNINCIIVKDFSRFGREHTEAGRYLEKIFPFLGVRFISVNDGYDSFDRESGDKKLAVVLKNLVNEYVARDISAKTASGYAAKQERGEYDGGRAPYGYVFSDKRKTGFAADEKPAEIVRDIFAWTIQGDCAGRIVKRLTEKKINPPKAYQDTGAFYRQENENRYWNEPAVNAILGNMAYAGHMALCKGKGTGAGGRSYKSAESEWRIKEHTHEPIVPEDDFRLVQEILKARKERYKSRCAVDTGITRPENLLKGKVFCGDCLVPAARMGTNYERKTGTDRGRVRVYRYRCRTYREKGKAECSSKSISEKSLEKLVWQAVALCVKQRESRGEAASGFYSEFFRKIKRETEKEKAIEEDAVRRKKNEKMLLYREYKKGELSFADGLSDGGKNQYMEEKQKKENAIRLHEKRIGQLEEKAAFLERMEKERPGLCGSNFFHKNIIADKAGSNLDPEMVFLFVDKIFLYDGKKVEIVMNFKEEGGT